uniref:Uncharacterized protein n=1 Tax=Rhizophora mucronata TaxID=61149 RepID=A0A2P2R3Q0_RHIMU
MAIKIRKKSNGPERMKELIGTFKPT